MKNTTWLVLMVVLFGLHSKVVWCQNESTEKIPVYETFRTYYLVSGQSTETLYARDLFFNISHRFGGYLSDGVQELFGLDAPSNIRLELMYGLTENLDIGFGRSKYLKNYDWNLKYRIVQQKEQGFPFTVTVFGTAGLSTVAWTEQEKASLKFKHRVSYLGQVLLASKVASFLSVQLTPTYVHRNLVNDLKENNGVFALGLATSVRLTPSMSIKAEYFHRFSENELLDRTIFQVFGLSYDMCSERHSYQIQFTNNTGLVGTNFIPDTRDDFFGGKIHLGMRITRKFAL